MIIVFSADPGALVAHRMPAVFLYRVVGVPEKGPVTAVPRASDPSDLTNDHIRPMS
jgi:hypothetical protein